MSLAPKVEALLGERGIDYQVHEHPRTMTAAEAAHSGHVPESAFAKAVVLKDEDGYFLAVLPASREIELGLLWRQRHRPTQFASEEQIVELFPDCDRGAVPPLGEAYGLETIVDDSLLSQPQVYFEGGDHEHMVALSGKAFVELMGTAQHGSFAYYRDSDSLGAHPS